jgi:hypothetical protein
VSKKAQDHHFAQAFFIFAKLYIGVVLHLKLHHVVFGHSLEEEEEDNDEE